MVVQSNGKTSKPLASTAALRDAIQKRFTGVLFEVPGYDLCVEITALKRAEREAIVAKVENVDGRWDNLLQNRMVVAYAMLNPPVVEMPRNTPAENDAYVRTAIEALKQWPDSLIDPIAGEIWKISNTYVKEVEEKIADVPPFPRMSGLHAGSSTETEPIPSSSSAGPKRSATASTSGT